jgi:hypothetical protein
MADDRIRGGRMTPGGTNTSAARPPPPPPPRLSHANDAAHANELSEHSLSALEEELKGGREGEGEGAPSAPAHPPVVKSISPVSLSPKLAKRMSGGDGFGEDELAPGRCAAFKTKSCVGRHERACCWRPTLQSRVWPRRV